MVWEVLEIISWGIPWVTIAVQATVLFRAGAFLDGKIV
jgi:hypothetical protein